MLTAGDEFGRSQGGNNNAYCQDNEISWVDWDLSTDQQDLLATARFLLAQRRTFSALRTNSFFRGRPPEDAPEIGVDLAWFTASGEPFTDGHWHDPHERAIQMVRRGRNRGDAAILTVINGSHTPVDVRLTEPPGSEAAQLAESEQPAWTLLWDSAWANPDERLAADITHSRAVLDPFTVRLYASGPPPTQPGPTSAIG